MDESENRQATPVLRIHHARKEYPGGTVALKGVDLHLNKGEWLGLLGPNGAGKTTLVKAIAGRVRLDEGTVELLGCPLRGTAGAAQALARAKLGVVPQEIALYPLLTARENLDIFAALAGLDGAARKEAVAWGLEFAGLADRATDCVKSFSGGMKRRLNIAASVIHRPEVILLDEPTVGVDPQSRERIWTMLSQLQQEGASLLLTSHQLDEVERVCERIVIIDHGAVVADGTIDQLIAQTVGSGRRVTVQLDQVPTEAAVQAAGACEVSGSTMCITMENVGTHLVPTLNRVIESGCIVQDVHIEKPTLQAVFIHLTGRELRE